MRSQKYLKIILKHSDFITEDINRDEIILRYFVNAGAHNRETIVCSHTHKPCSQFSHDIIRKVMNYKINQSDQHIGQQEHPRMWIAVYCVIREQKV
jgi:hypothetical protein